MAERRSFADACGLIAAGGDRVVDRTVEMFWYTGETGRGTAFFSSVSMTSFIGYALMNSGSSNTVAKAGTSPASMAALSAFFSLRMHIPASNASFGCLLYVLIA